MLRTRLVASILFSFSLTVSACGGAGGGDSNGAEPGEDDGGGAGGSPSGGDMSGGGDVGGGEAGGGGAHEAGSGGDDEDSGIDAGPGGDIDGSMSEVDGGSACKTTCAPDDCGELVSDGCGGFIKCRAHCPEGQGCGLVRPDKCDPPPSSCTPKTEAMACDGKCGVVSDGCSSVYTCSGGNGGVTCGAGERCVESEGASDRNTCAAIPNSCVAQTCAQQNVACGLAGDGCGNVLNCTTETGGCTTGKVCGTGVDSGKCVDPPPPSCQALTLTEACAGTCGTVDDGCGNALNCESSPMTACMAPETCGGGITPGVCGSGGSCVPVSERVACAGKCGTVSNGCGGAYTCNATNDGDTCDSNIGEECVLGVCTAPPCTAKTVAQACPASGGHKRCGLQPDGCGGTVNCGGCASDEACGLAGPSLCGPLPTCQPASCSGKCGTMADGCGGTITCSPTNGGVACTGSEYCGATQANRCGTPPITCTPRDCDDLGHSCGLATDGCGHAINCWSGCSENDTNCVGSCGTNNACLSNATTGVQSCVAGTPSCTGSLCGSLPPSCPANSPTRLTGTVRTPGREGTTPGTRINELPVPNAIVYIPADTAAALPAIFEGVDAGNAASCGRCEDEKLVADGQSVLAAGVTNARGEFTLEGRIPVGVAFELVIKIGKWRRVVSVPAGTAQSCTSRPLGSEYTRLARNSTDGLSGTHLPKIAISTGAVDEMECVFRAIGIDEAEFGPPGSNARVQMYRANGARIRNNTGACTGNYDPPGNNNTVGCTSMAAPVNGNGCAAGLAGCSYSYGATDVSSSDANLYGSQNTINGYDLVVWDCEGTETFEGRCANDSSRQCESSSDCTRVCSNNTSRSCSGNSGCEYRCTNNPSIVCTNNNQCSGGSCARGTCGNAACGTSNAERVRAYVDAGGRMFASHYSYVWIENNGTLDNSANWGGANGSPTDQDTAYISLPSGTTQRTGANGVKSVLLRDWLTYQGTLAGTSVGQTTSPNTPQFTVHEPRDRAGANVGASTDEWVYRNTGSGDDLPKVQQLSFNTPYGAAETAICGRVAYSGFHVSDSDNDDSNDYFPGVCSNASLNAQEKILAFMLFDLATCVSAGDPPQPPSCTAKTVANTCPGVNDACGYLADGCGGVVDCGGCASGFYCDGNACRPQQCTPATCASLGYNCGSYADGCGGIARNAQGTEGCGSCSGGQLCGLGGAGLCGSASCTPIPFATACPTNSCGTVSNGCGGTWNCGSCVTGQVCGGSGANRCGSGSCTQIPQATACQGKNCGVASDGCGGGYDCGTCTAPDSCGGGGQANVCGHPQCTPFTQQQACTNKQCGWVSDGCGGAINCGTCPSGGVCGGAGPNLCGSTCTPTTCEVVGAQCGAIGDGCGGVLSCGNCPQGQTCGAAGPNKCGVGQTCTRRDCAAASAQCGLVGDGCGGVLDCGPCTAPGQTCGGAGQANQCGTGTGGCNKLTCDGQGVQCGAASDGCGGLLDCGGCALGYACERGQCVALPPILL